jgi:hypothetical protein
MFYQKMKQLLFILVLLAAPSSKAYQCERPAREVQKEFLAASSTFVGKVIHIGKKTKEGRVPVRFSVETIFRYKKEPRKAEKLERLVHFNTLDDGEFTCTKIELQRSYLVYAFSEGDKLITNVCVRGALNRNCHRTRALEIAQEDLAALGVAKK